MGERPAGALRATRALGARVAAALLALAGACALAAPAPAGADIFATPGQLVAYENAGDIWVVDVRGLAPPINLTQSPGVAEHHPSWGFSYGGCISAPDGSGFLPPDFRSFVYESGGDVVLTTVHGSSALPSMAPLAQRDNLTSTFAPSASAPAIGWRDGGQLVAFAAGPPGDRDLWVKSLGSSDPVRLTSGPGDDANPDWSGDGSAIVYDTALPGQPRQLMILDVVGGPQVSTLGPGPGGPRPVIAGLGHADPSWFGVGEGPEAPDHALLSTTRVGDLSYVDMLVQPPTPGHPFSSASFPPATPYELTGEPGGDEAPAWDPGGDYAVLQSDRAAFGNVDLYRVDANGEQFLRLTSDPGADVDPDWEPWLNSGGGRCFEVTPRSPRPGRKPRVTRRAVASSTGSGSAISLQQLVRPRPRPRPRPRVRLSIRDVHAGSARVRGSRIVFVSLVVNQFATARLDLVRRRHVLATKRPVLLGGRNRLWMPVPVRLAAGAYGLRLTVRAQGGGTRRFALPVRIGQLAGAGAGSRR